ncbi:right oriC-binding transcriptional activator [Edwardsiella tarda]|nr:right oriC-binding transcriptional activator [Edwardsiella tarda]
MTTQGQHQLLVDALIQWIEQNLDKRILIDDIADRAGYSKWYLQRLFKEVTGYNLAAYVRRRRLIRAAAELQRSNKKIMEITLQYGFDSQQTFSRAFKRRYGTSPGSYRQRADAQGGEHLCGPLLAPM